MPYIQLKLFTIQEDILQMAIPVNGLVEIVLSGRVLGIPWNNVYHYWDTSDSVITDMPTIASQFNAFVANSLPTLTTPNTKYDNIKIRDVLGNVPDYDEPPTDPDGNKIESVMPSFNAVRVDYMVTTKDTNRGYKRYPGVPEEDVNLGDLTPTALAAWSAFQTQWLQPLVAGGKSYQPVVYGRATPTQPTRKVVNIVTSIVVRPEITSQTSRK